VPCGSPVGWGEGVIARTASAPTRPPCPSWCQCDYDFGEQSWNHRGPVFRLTYQDPNNPDLPHREVVVELDRFDTGGGVGAIEVLVGAVETNVRGERRAGGLHPENPLSIDDTERLANLLLRVVEFGRTGKS
jgi:hypothetical protein